jgi:hypothetical protein
MPFPLMLTPTRAITQDDGVAQSMWRYCLRTSDFFRHWGLVEGDALAPVVAACGVRLRQRRGALFRRAAGSLFATRTNSAGGSSSGRHGGVRGGGDLVEGGLGSATRRALSSTVGT